MMKLIKTTVLDTTAASVTISNIPQEFKSLKLIVSVRSSFAYASIWVRPNNSVSNITNRVLEGYGSGVASATTTGNILGQGTGSGATANTFSNTEFTFPNYSSSSYKTVFTSTVNENNGTLAYQDLIASLWSENTAITSFTILPSTDGSAANFVAGSTFYLYGIA